MRPKISPPDRNAAAIVLMQIYAETERKIIQEIIRKRDQGYVDYAELAALRRIRQYLQEMVDGSAEYVPLAIEYEFYKGPAARAGYANALGTVSMERDRVMEQLVDNLLGEVQEMAQTAYQSAEAQLFLIGRTSPDVFREAGLTGAISAQAEGKGALRTVGEVMRSVEEAGITAFVDKSGRQWSLRSYGNMAVRTTMRQAQTSAVLTSDEHDLYKILQHYAPCRLCASYSGRVYSKNGTNPHYPPLAAAFGKIDPAGPDDLSNTFLNIHPNCLCTLVKWTEASKTQKEIEKAREQSSFEKNPPSIDPRSKKQIAAYQEKERARARLREDYKQYDRYAKTIPGMPSRETFLKHKRLDDDKYKAWEAAYRAARRKTS